MDFINVTIASDNNYAQHVAVVVASILCNTKTPSAVRFFILNDNISHQYIDLISKTVTNLNGNVEFINVSDLSVFNRVYLSGHISKAAYFRLYLPNVLPANVKKVIYLDVDLIVNRDIVELWKADIGNYPIAAVSDFGILASKRSMREKTKSLGTKIKRYFNSGVLVVNIDEWRKKDYSAKIVQLLKRNNFTHHDQDVLNKFFGENWYELPLEWNVIPPVFCLAPKILFSGNFRRKAICARRNMFICHYAGRYKPWEFSLHKGFNDDYYKYLSLTSFKDMAMPKPGKDMRGKSILRQLFKSKLADCISYLFYKFYTNSF